MHRNGKVSKEASIARDDFSEEASFLTLASRAIYDPKHSDSARHP